MQGKRWLVCVFLLITVCSIIYGQDQTSAGTPARPLRNGDVVLMVEAGQKSDQIIGKIFTSHCNFDIFPPVLRDLKRRGVPDTVILAMKSAPSGPPALADVDAKIAAITARVLLPGGTAIEVESSKAYSSANLQVGDLMSFAVMKRIFVNNVLVVERGAAAIARVVQRKRAGRLGRPGMLAWEMLYVTGVDGTHIPIKLAGKQHGTSRRAAVVGGAVATGALVFPYTSPVALIWGLKKGDEAVLRGSKLFSAQVGTNAEVTGLQPRPAGVVYRDRETVKASTAPPTNTQFERGSFKPKGSFKPNQ
jgi:hypothetical protein